MHRLLRSRRNLDPYNRATEVMPCDCSCDTFKRGRVCTYIYGNRHEWSGRQPMEMPVRIAFLDLDQHTTLILVLLAKVDPLDAARIHNRRVLAQDLMFMDMPHRNVVDIGQRHDALWQYQVFSQHDLPLDANRRAV